MSVNQHSSRDLRMRQNVESNLDMYTLVSLCLHWTDGRALRSGLSDFVSPPACYSTLMVYGAKMGRLRANI